jgi:hypothetical protein
MDTSRRKWWGLGAVLVAAIGTLALVFPRDGRDLDRAALRVADAPCLPPVRPPPARRAAEAPGDAPLVESSRQRARRRALERSVRIDGTSRPGQLSEAGGWGRALALHRALPPVAGAAAERTRLKEALAGATDPVARQNLIFLAVLTLPPERSHPWLRALAAGTSAADAEDAVVALAFDGDDEGRAAFARLAGAPSAAPVHRLLDDFLDHEELGRSGTGEARAVLRSYRAIEVLDREPYFKWTFCGVRHAEWRPHPARTPELDRELLAEWLARYPGHPGSDDMAVRLGRLATARGAHVEAARWYSRAATMPDQDLVAVAVGDLVATSELLLTPEELDGLAHEQGALTPNRALLQYIRLRRMAAERGFDVAVRHAEALGRDEPLSVLGHSWNHRRAGPLPRGLDSGLAPLPADDPLRGRERNVPPLARPEGMPDPMSIPWCLRNLEWRSRDAEERERQRLHPWPERLQLEQQLVMKQLRAWEAIATLDRRAALERGDARADLLYKQAALFYHDPRVLYPVYAEIVDFRRVFSHVTGKGDGPPRTSFGAIVRTSYSLLRAIRLFERIEREHPGYAGLDRVLFSKGLAWKKLLRWLCDGVEGGYVGEDPEPRRTKIRLATEAFERCAALFPGSPLADDALRAASYWRKTWPKAFE